MSEPQQENLISKCIEKIDSIHKENYQDKTFLVTADSNKFLSRVSNIPYIRIIEGRSVHMDKMTKQSRDDYSKVFVDMIMLSKAEKILLLCTGEMYKGAFAKTASLIGKTPYEIVYF